MHGGEVRFRVKPLPTYDATTAGLGYDSFVSGHTSISSLEACAQRRGDRWLTQQRVDQFLLQQCQLKSRRVRRKDERVASPPTAGHSAKQNAASHQSPA